MDLIITILPVVTEDLPISPRFTPSVFVPRCKFSTLASRKPMVEHAYGMHAIVCMYVCMVITYSRVWINRVRLPVLLVVS